MGKVVLARKGVESLRTKASGGREVFIDGDGMSPYSVPMSERGLP